MDNFDEIAKIIADSSYQGDVFHASLRMIYDVQIRKEVDELDSNKINQYLQNSNNNRSGLQCMNYLFDVINEVAGYTQKYYDESTDIVDHEGLVKKYRAERLKYTDLGLEKSELLGDHNPHCLMVIEGI